MRAVLLQRIRKDFDDGAVLEMVIWEVPAPIKGSTHRYKYRLFYGRAGERIVAYDNERGKGDHRHVDGVEERIRFSTIDALVGEFLDAVAKRRTA
jgi:hypothetical protein